MNRKKVKSIEDLADEKKSEDISCSSFSNLKYPLFTNNISGSYLCAETSAYHSEKIVGYVPSIAERIIIFIKNYLKNRD